MLRFLAAVGIVIWAGFVGAAISLMICAALAAWVDSWERGAGGAVGVVWGLCIGPLSAAICAVIAIIKLSRR